MSAESLSIVGGTYFHGDIIQHQPVVFQPPDGFSVAVRGSRERCRQGGKVAGIEPPPAAVALPAVSAFPKVVVLVPGGEGRAVMLGGKGIVGEVPREAA